ncbi:MAG: DUF6785 family protein [Chloroherpetonaceae bacterium]|nr:hypothetical protein [Chthonomonadaceae bacterium]MDW8208723.1 DUF6785 family protein [Chloroherpetonaceae bacterium]
MSSSPSSPPDRSASGRRSGLTVRALVLGILFTGLTDLWIHWAELVLGGRGHTALAGTAIPVGAFNVLFLLVVTNLLLHRVLRPLAFSPAELLVIYVMMTVSTVVSSSGGLHFLIPTITAAFWYADESNGWANLFHAYIPEWIAQRDRDALRGFYVGNATVPWAEWVRPMSAWIAFLAIFTLGTLCLVAILRRQWVDRERLTFPTVVVPVEMIRDGEHFLRNRLLWLGFAIPFGIDIMNTLHLNIPPVPYLPTRTTDQPDISTFFAAPPWNAIGPTPISFYPFVIGIAYLLSVEMTFSCWFFWLITKLLRVYGAASGLSSGATGGGQSAWPFLGHQGAGAFLALTLAGLWLSRAYLVEAWHIAFGPRPRGPAADQEEPLPYRWAFLGLFACLAFATGWCIAAGMRSGVALTLILLSLCYMIAAARIRAETGNAWLFGPDVDAYKVMTTTFGTMVYSPADLTVMAYIRNAISTFDLRCLSMPHQFDAYRMADTVPVSRRHLTFALALAVVLGLVLSFAIALMIWYAYGAGAKTDAWRTSMGRMPFDQLSDALKTPVKADVSGSLAIGAGFGITTALMLLRTRITWWIFHPVGYAVANTGTMNQVWLPFFIAWLLKVVALRYGGIQLYRRSLPFFYGVIIGDFLAGGLTTLLGCFLGINAYPINW